MKKKRDIKDCERLRWADLVRQKRTELDETQQAFAARFGLSGQGIQQWEAQGNLPNPQNRFAMAKLCGWTTDQLNHYLETGEMIAADGFDIEKVIQQLKAEDVGVVVEMINKASMLLKTRLAS
jgi:DNA-binding XRE family transcriptional regulator